MTPEELEAIFQKYEDDAYKTLRRTEVETEIRVIENAYDMVKNNNEDSPALDRTLYRMACEIRRLQEELHRF